MIILISKTKVNLFTSSTDVEENPLHKESSGIHYSSTSTFENSELENYIINQNLDSTNNLY